MLNCLNGSDTAIIVLHEIYGINQHITEVCQRLAREGFDVLCPNLLSRNTVYDYSREDEAYKDFYGGVGLQGAFNRVKELLIKCRKRYKGIFVMGYSVGASIGWLCSGESDLCDGVIGFYGSRIRDHLEVIPACPVLLFFPAKEESFDVTGLIEELVRKERVVVRQLAGSHGFADPFSGSYTSDSCKLAEKTMMEFIGNLSLKGGNPK